MRHIDCLERGRLGSLQQESPMRRLLCRAGSLALLAVLAGGCSDAGPSNMTQLGFNLATRPSITPVRAAAFDINGTPESFTDLGGNSLVINKVELVLREI